MQAERRQVYAGAKTVRIMRDADAKVDVADKAFDRVEVDGDLRQAEVVDKGEVDIIAARRAATAEQAFNKTAGRIGDLSQRAADIRQLAVCKRIDDAAQRIGNAGDGICDGLGQRINHRRQVEGTARQVIQRRRKIGNRIRDRLQDAA